MKNGSAPGGDGLTVVVVVVFLPTYTQRQGIIISLHKGKDLPRDRLNNWRPITLTNTDYKILANVMARRMGLVVNKLINEDQAQKHIKYSLKRR